MQVVSDLTNLKYLYDKVSVGKIINRNLKELIKNPEFCFDDEINNMNNIRNSILTEQYKGLNMNLLNLYKEYLFYFETFKRKKLLKDKKKMYTNDIFEKNKKLEYELEEENIIILYNIGFITSYMVKEKKSLNDIKLLNKISTEAIEIFNYMFQHMNELKLQELNDINCISCYIFLCITLAYHENMFYNTAMMKKYKRKLLAKLSFNIYTYFNEALCCLQGDMLPIFKQSDNFTIARNNLQYIRNPNSYLYNIVQVNKQIFISISNYHYSLKYVQLSDMEELKVTKYEEDKIGEILCRLNFSLINVNRGIELCKKYNINVNFLSLKEKIMKLLDFFEYENKNIYFEVVPDYDNLESIKGTQVTFMKNIEICDIYIKKNISNNLKLLFNEKAKYIYDSYNNQALPLYEYYNKHFLNLKDQYELLNISHRKDILLLLNNSILNIFSKKKQIYNPIHYDNHLTFLSSVENNLKDILIEADNYLTIEHNNHLEFQKIYLNVTINQESVNSYNNFLFHLNSFKTLLHELSQNIITFKTYLENNHEKLKICEMDVTNFFEYIINQLNISSNIHIDNLDEDYNHYKNLLSEENDQDLSSINSTSDIEPISSAMSLNYSDFHNFLKKKKLLFAIHKWENNQYLFHYNTLSKYINLHLEERLYFVLTSLYFSMNIQLTNFSNDLTFIRNGLHDQFLNSITEEKDSERLNVLLEKQKELLNAKKIKLEERITLFEKDLNQFYNYYHEYNKLESFKTIEDFGAFMNELTEICSSLNTTYKKHEYTLKNAMLFKDDINRYIYMRESERSQIRIQQIPNNYSRNIQNSTERYY
ncbi:hypothetical protein PRSY57_1223500 [Plasmodium reichenowi]|uniref:BRO1 domain-containing protein n=1 Tax=Plasmodium reichenowi TaxID=5854 RepID=A0A151L8Y0_PLARE|nr:hypothetical protein PRSY57_1223500 [Plasmodium reichenowi]KYN95347.1 hypothetical protein PRSY57_1223500 [Plasmodium reichenowi]